MTICHLTNVRRTMTTNGSLEVPRYAQVDKTEELRPWNSKLCRLSSDEMKYSRIYRNYGD